MWISISYGFKYFFVFVYRLKCTSDVDRTCVHYTQCTQHLNKNMFSRHTQHIIIRLYGKGPFIYQEETRCHHYMGYSSIGSKSYFICTKPRQDSI